MIRPAARQPSVPGWLRVFLAGAAPAVVATASSLLLLLLGLRPSTPLRSVRRRMAGRPAPARSRASWRSDLLTPSRLCVMRV